MDSDFARKNLNAGIRCILFFLSFLLLVFVTLPTPSLAQTSTTGSISGIVTDPSNAAIPNAKVAVKSLADGSVEHGVTNSHGQYSVPFLKPGNFMVTIEATGFQPITLPANVYIGRVTTSSAQLKVAVTATTVTVTTAQPLLQTHDVNMSATVNANQVSNIPNGGEDLTGIMQSTPGAVMNTEMGYGNFETYGMPAASNLFTVDGMPDNDPFFGINNSGATNLMLGQSGIEEVTITNNGYSGNFGGYAGSNINYTTKSGTDAFHGQVDYRWNGRVMNANDWFNNQSATPRPFDNVNQYDASMGGPIIKRHLFFFGSYEGIRILLPTSSLVDLPSPAFESATLAQIDNTYGANSASDAYYKKMFNLWNNAPGASRATAGAFPGDTTGGCPAGANFLSSSYWTAQNSSTCVVNFRSGVGNLTHEWLTEDRIDWNASPNDKVYGRIGHDVGLQATYTDPISKIFNADSYQPEWSNVVEWTHIFSPTTSNHVVLSDNWYSAIFTANNLKAATSAFPSTLSMGDGSFTGLGGLDFIWPQGRNITQYGIADDWSKIISNHSLKLGVNFYRFDTSDWDYGFFSTPLEVPVTMDALFYGGTDPTLFTTDTSPDYSILEQAFPTATVQPLAQYSLGGYVEDDWQARSNLLITLAFRVDHPSNPICQHLCMARLSQSFGQVLANNSPDALLTQPYNQAIVAGQRQTFADMANVMWEPRFGFAWTPFGAGTGTVLRGGFGMFSDQFASFASESMSENPPYYNFFVPFFDNLAPGETNCLGSTGASGSGCGNLYADAVASNQSFVQGFASGANALYLFNTNPFFSPPTLNVAVAKFHVPMYEKWNLELQHQFGQNTSVDINYVGNHGYHEFIENPSANAFGFGSLPPANSDTSTLSGYGCVNFGLACAPDPAFGEVNVFTSGGVSNYNGVTVGFTHRYSSGMVQAFYTYSHAFDIVSNGGALPFISATNTSLLSPQNPYGFRASYGPADYDIRHSFIGKYVWDLPIRRYLLFGHGPASLVNGWQVAGTIFLHSGFPFTAENSTLASGLNSVNFFGPIYANNFTGSEASCSSPSSQCLTTSQFQAYDAQSTFGNTSRNMFRGPGYFNSDFSIMKNTSIPGWERGKLGIGLSFYNVFNHPNFDLPVGNIGDSKFGTIHTAVGPPTSILASFLGGDSSPRMIQIVARLSF